MTFRTSTRALPIEGLAGPFYPLALEPLQVAFRDPDYPVTEFMLARISRKQGATFQYAWSTVGSGSWLWGISYEMEPGRRIHLLFPWQSEKLNEKIALYFEGAVTEKEVDSFVTDLVLGLELERSRWRDADAPRRPAPRRWWRLTFAVVVFLFL